MRKSFFLLVALGLVLGWAGSSTAHLDDIFFIIQFPDQAVPTIDGDHSDWEIAPTNPYTIGNDKIYDPSQRHELGRGELDASNCNIRHRVGWNDTFNKLYFATEVFDNFHKTNREDPGKFFKDDAWEVNVNYDHTFEEEQNQDFANGFAWKFAVPPIEGAYFFFRPGKLKGITWLVPGTEYTDFAYTFTGEEFGECTYYYELAITPFESMPLDEATSQEGAVIADLEEGEVIHVQIDVSDPDDDAPTGNTIKGFWSTEPGPYTGTPNTDFVLTELDPQMLANLEATSVETDTWGRIKSQFK